LNISTNFEVNLLVETTRTVLQRQITLSVLNLLNWNFIPAASSSCFVHRNTGRRAVLLRQLSFLFFFLEGGKKPW